MADQRQAGSLWTPEEDVVLLRHVAKYGTKHWGYLQTSGILPHRDQKACCNRFTLLKRKFFQARAKGQRLTFPVVPQSELSRSSGGNPKSASASLGHLRASLASSVSSGFPSRSSPLQTVPSVSFKKSFPGSLSAAARHVSLLRSSTNEGSVGSDNENASGGFQVESSPMTRRTNDTLSDEPATTSALVLVPAQQVPAGKPHPQPHPAGGESEAHLPSLAAAPVSRPQPQPQAAVTGSKLHLPSLAPGAGTKLHRPTPIHLPAAPLQVDDLLTSDSMPALVDQQQTRPLTAIDSFDAGFASPRVGGAFSAAWRCFNPALLDAVLPPPAPADSGLPPANHAFSLDADAMGVAPDALLDMMASSPVQMMFGSKPTGAVQAGSSPAAYSCAEGNVWRGSVPSSDLWDLVRTSASL